MRKDDLQRYAELVLFWRDILNNKVLVFLSVVLPLLFSGNPSYLAMFLWYLKLLQIICYFQIQFRTAPRGSLVPYIRCFR